MGGISVLIPLSWIPTSNRERHVHTHVLCSPQWLDDMERISEQYWVEGRFDGQFESDSTMRILTLPCCRYADLLLLHWPCEHWGDTMASYSAMEAALKAGKTRAIGTM